MITRFLLVFVVAYLLGSVSFAIVVSKTLFKKDIRSFGSGNAGMTNVLRTFGKKAAALT
ncbi:MAG: glycerol-3-phosphate acyltransferase, partial [Oscillospiraceae bacterium]